MGVAVEHHRGMRRVLLVLTVLTGMQTWAWAEEPGIAIDASMGKRDWARLSVHFSDARGGPHFFRVDIWTPDGRLLDEVIATPTPWDTEAKLEPDILYSATVTEIDEIGRELAAPQRIRFFVIGDDLTADRFSARLLLFVILPFAAGYVGARLLVRLRTPSRNADACRKPSFLGAKWRRLSR
jgi:hypothetical protein